MPALVAMTIALASTPRCARSERISGHWVGTVENGRSRSTLILDLGSSGGGRAALPDLALYDLPLVRAGDGKGMRLRALFHGHAVDAILHREGQALAGTAVSGSEHAIVRLRRTGASEPLPYREESLVIAGGPKPVAATLFVPLTPPPHPALVMVHGSHGPARNDLRGPAILFARSGIAVLIYDKRGLGSDQSLPHRYAFLELADDAVRAIDAMAARRDIDRRHLGVWGISEGGWIAPAIAARSPLVRFLITVSAPAVSYATVVDVTTRRALARGKFTDKEIADAISALHRINDFVRHGGDRAALNSFLEAAARTSWGPALGILLPRHAPTAEEMLHQVRWRELDVDPAAWWRSVHVPVFAVWGEADDHPVAESVAVIRTALAAAGNGDATLIVYPGADHELLVRETDAKSWPRLVPGFIQAMTSWTRMHVGLPDAPRTAAGRVQSRQ